MDRNCSVCDRKLDKNIYLKHRTICKKCHNNNRRKNDSSASPQNQQLAPSENETCSSQHHPKIDSNNHNDSAHENHAFDVIGSRNVAKTYYMLKKLEKIGNKKNYSYNNSITQSISKLKNK